MYLLHSRFFKTFVPPNVFEFMKRCSKISYAAIAACCSVMIACNGSPSTADFENYATLTVEKSSVTLMRDYSATIRGRQDIDIFPQVSGTITEVRVSEGEAVKRGQTLFVIDQVPFEAALQMADANVEAAEAAVATARLTADSKRKLFERGVVSDFELQTAENALATAKAQLAQMKAVQVDARNNYSYTMVKSPSDGVVGTIPFRAGTLVSPQIQRPLTTVSDNSQMYVYFSITENNLLDMVSGYGSAEEALRSLPAVSLRMSNGALYPEKGRIESISGVINASTGTVSLRAVFPNGRRILHSGASGNVLMPAVCGDAIVIPKTATFEIQDRTYVYVVTPEGTAASRSVKVAPSSTAAEYIVTDGLAEGEEIVIEGVALLRDGERVKRM